MSTNILKSDFSKMTKKLIQQKPFGITFTVEDGCLKCKQLNHEGVVGLGGIDDISNIEIGEGCVAIDYLKDDTGTPYTLCIDEHNVY